jgi:hypothetical protein
MRQRVMIMCWIREVVGGGEEMTTPAWLVSGGSVVGALGGLVFLPP